MNKKLVEMRKGKQRSGLLALAAWLLGKSGGRPLAGVEVGTYRGEGAELLCRSGAVSELWCVDPWLNGYDKKDAASSSDMSAAEAEFDRRLGENPQMRKFKGTLAEFAGAGLAPRPDFVYVDACHKYEGVKSDLGLVLGRLRPSMAVCGHDYVDGWPGVKKAVDELLGKPDAVFEDGSWAKLL